MFLWRDGVSAKTYCVPAMIGLPAAMRVDELALGLRNSPRGAVNLPACW